MHGVDQLVEGLPAGPRSTTSSRCLLTPSRKEYAAQWLASFISGDVQREEFLHLNGSGSNGKSKTNELSGGRSIRKAADRRSSRSAAPRRWGHPGELRARGAALCVLQEPESEAPQRGHRHERLAVTASSAARSTASSRARP
jgi:hypothetical protein